MAAVLLAFAPALGSERTLARRDSARQIGPARALVAEALRDGRLPLWNPREGTGKPLFADGVHSVLHPVSIAGALVAPRSIDFLLVGYLIVAAMGAYVLARSLGTSPAAAAAAGVAYATCGFTLSMTGNPVFLAGAGAQAWMLASARHAGGGSAWGSVACALATALAFASGDVQATILGGLIGAVLAAGIGGRAGLGRAAAGMAAGALLAGVQIAASWELLRSSIRGMGLSAGELVQWALHPARLLEWIVPGLARGEIGEQPAADLLGGPLYGGPFAESVYLGAPLLLLAAFGISGARRRMRLILLALLLLLAWIAMGHHLGARWILDAVPVWNRFRFAEKMMAPISLVVCAAAAMGIDRLARERLTRPLAVAALGAGLAAVVALMAILAAPHEVRGILARASAEGAEFLAGNLRAGLVHLALGAGALLVLDRRSSSVRHLASVALVIASTVVAIPYGAHFGLESAQTAPIPFALEAAPPGPRLAHPFSPRLPDAVGLGLDAVDRSILLERTALWPSWNVADGKDSISEYSGLKPLRLNTLETSFGTRWWLVARRFGVTHVVLTWWDVEAEGEMGSVAVAGGMPVFQQAIPPLQVWAVPHAPWASFAQSAEAVSGPVRALEAVAAAASAGDYGASIAVEAGVAPSTGRGRVLTLARGTEEVRLVAEADSEALLVVRDAFWPGWRAWIDGREVEVLAADLLVRAVVWPAGRHSLVMSYEPSEVRVGWALSGLGVIAVVALATVARRRKAPATPATEDP